MVEYIQHLYNILQVLLYHLCVLPNKYATNEQFGRRQKKGILK